MTQDEKLAVYRALLPGPYNAHELAKHWLNRARKWTKEGEEEAAIVARHTAVIFIRERNRARGAILLMEKELGV